MKKVLMPVSENILTNLRLSAKVDAHMVNSTSFQVKHYRAVFFKAFGWRRIIDERIILLSLAIIGLALSGCEKSIDATEENGSAKDVTNDLISNSSAKLYVANSGDGTVSVIGTLQNEVIKTISVGFSPSVIAVQPERMTAYVAGSISKDISVINTDVDIIRKSIEIPGFTVHITAGSSEMAYLIVDPDTNIINDQYIGGIKLGADIFVDSLFFDDVCNSLKYLAYCSTGILYGASHILPTCDFFQAPMPFIVNTGTGEVISPNTFVSRIVKLSSDEKFLYIIGNNFEGGGEDFYIFNTEVRKFVKDIAVESGLTAIAISSDGLKVYIADNIDPYISVLDLVTYRIEDSIAVNSPVYDLLVTGGDEFLYASHPSTNRVSVINLKTKVTEQEIDVGAVPTAIALIPPSF